MRITNSSLSPDDLLLYILPNENHHILEAALIEKWTKHMLSTCALV